MNSNDTNALSPMVIVPLFPPHLLYPFLGATSKEKISYNVALMIFTHNNKNTGLVTVNLRWRETGITFATS